MTITPELRTALDHAQHVRIEDSETHETYVVLKAEVFDRIRTLIEPDVSESYPLAMKVFGADGWDDPIMDEYNALDPRRS